MKRSLLQIIVFYCICVKLIQSLGHFGTQHDCYLAVVEILQFTAEDRSVGQVLVPYHWFDTTTNQCSGSLGESDVPLLVYGRTAPMKNHSSRSSKHLIHLNKFSPARFAHLSLSTFSSDEATRSDALQQQLWRKLIYLTFRRGNFLRPSDLQPQSSLQTSLKNAWHSSIQKDLTIVTFDVRKLNNFVSPAHDLFIAASKESIWLGYNIQSTYANFSSLRPLKLVCLFSKGTMTNLLSNNSRCNGHSAARSHINVFLRYYLAAQGIRRQNHTQIALPSGRRLETEVDIRSYHDFQSLGASRKKLDLLSRKGLLYSSLVFIAKKLPETTSTTNNWGPFSLSSWLGILGAYTLTAIVFAGVKLITLSNVENSWHNCILKQLFQFMNRRNVLGTEIVDENCNEVKVNSRRKKSFSTFLPSEDSCEYLEVRRISVRSLTTPDWPENSSHVFVDVKYDETRGKLSKSILYGTARVVSFILLAMYEGKLYNTITFPKTRLVATFDELISNDKYFIKVTPEAAKLENITGQGSSRRQNVNVSVSNIGESLNILDCVNWVESGSDPNHACVGYDFELRNLHKAHKSDKVLVRSKQRLIRVGSSGKLTLVPGGGVSNSQRFIIGGKRGFRMFPGGFQLSKWILESGILQLWSLVEKAFMESVVHPNWGDPFKVFKIRDYLSLFVVYAMLLILASIMFLLEHVVTLLKNIFRSETFRRSLHQGCHCLREIVRSKECCCWKGKWQPDKCHTFAFDWVQGSKYFRSSSIASCNRYPV